MILKNKMFLKVGVVALSVIMAFFFLFVSKSGALLSFGGNILYVTYCTCSFNLLLTVGPPRGGNFVYQPGVSILYSYGQVYRSVPWVLGGYVPGGMCSIYVGEGCLTVPSMGTITQVGTSL